MFFVFNDQLDVVFESIDQSVTYMYVMRDVGILFEYVKTSECRVDMSAGYPESLNANVEQRSAIALLRETCVLKSSFR
jgi:hypothetical protein